MFLSYFQGGNWDPSNMWFQEVTLNTVCVLVVCVCVLVVCVCVGLCVYSLGLFVSVLVRCLPGGSVFVGFSLPWQSSVRVCVDVV